MGDLLGKFASVLDKVKTPLSLAGLTVLVLYGLYSQVLGLEIFSQLDQTRTSEVLDSIVRGVFILALVAMVLGVSSYLLAPILHRRARTLESKLRIVDLREDPTLAIASKDATSIAADLTKRPTPNQFGSVSRVSPYTALDCKFVNEGDAASILWGISIDVLRVEIDRSPRLYFSWETVGGVNEHCRYVVLSCINVGWGPALDCRASIEVESMRRIFGEGQTVFEGTIEADQTVEIIRLEAPAQAIIQQMIERPERYGLNRSDVWTRGESRISKWWQPPDDRGVLLPDEWPIRVLHSDVYGTTADLEGVATNPRTRDFIPLTMDGYWFLTPKGFYAPASRPWYQSQDSYEAYAAVIDADRGSHTKHFPISRSVPSGDGERFHILLSATKSCEATVRVNFHTSGSRKDVMSDTVTLRIERTADQEIYEVTDGTELEISNGIVVLPIPAQARPLPPPPTALDDDDW